jgi:hypothetical protein
MNRRFIVILQNDHSPRQQERMMEFVKKNGFGWWHWVDNVWVLVDGSGTWTCPLLRDAFNNIFPSVHKLVLEGGRSWAGFGPSKPPIDWFTWMRENWE